jgi:hypothetical protein
MKAGVTRNPRKAGPSPNNRLPNGAWAMAESLDERDLLIAAILGNRATRRLARRNLRKRVLG